MKTLYILVGVPGSGKSTWISQQEWPEDTAFISTDKFVESFAASIGKTYSEVFDEYMSVAVNLMAEEVLEAKRAGRTIVWDQTSTTVKARKKKILMLPEYHKIAVILPTPEATELNRRLKSRRQ